ncbi:MAG: DUF1801 domain-containing protein [Chloroflexota bacterium]
METFVLEKFNSYPAEARAKLFEIREAIFELGQSEKIGEITETLKWGEPSYLAKKGSTVRMDWKSRKPDHVSLFFSCQTTLVETFRELYSDQLQFVDNREIALPISDDLPISELKACISMALRYHSIKHLPLLGA